MKIMSRTVVVTALISLITSSAIAKPQPTDDVVSKDVMQQFEGPADTATPGLPVTCSARCELVFPYYSEAYFHINSPINHNAGAASTIRRNGTPNWNDCLAHAQQACGWANASPIIGHCDYLDIIGRGRLGSVNLNGNRATVSCN